jgi:L-threonylcarbamoyladenylate synthase
MATILNGLNDPQLVPLLQQGSVGVLPTDTIYGLVCPAANQSAVERLYKLKIRENKPGTVIAANIEQLVQLGLKARYLKAVEQFWPGALTIIIPCGPELDYLDLGRRTLAVRLPNDKMLNTLINSTGPLLTSSANLPGELPAGTIKDAQSYFGDSVDFYVEGGDLSGREPSTIIRIVDDAVEVLRPGSVKIDEKTGKIL